MHTTKRPAADIRIPMGWEKAETLLADIADSTLLCAGHNYASKILFDDIGSKKGLNPVVQPERYIDTTVK